MAEPQQPIHILVVDDELDTRTLLKEVIEEVMTVPVVVGVAENGHMALGRLAIRNYHLVITDNLMPGMTGIELTQIIRAEPAYNDIKIVGISAHDLWPDFERAGANGFIDKPIGYDQLTETLNRFFQHPGTRINTMTNAPFKILVVEDEEMIREPVAEFLRTGCGLPAGSVVDIAKNGAEGAKMAAEGAYNLIFTDNNMPIITGMEMIRQIRADARIRNQPKIVMVASDGLGERIREQALEAGADDFMQKPSKPNSYRNHVGITLAHYLRQAAENNGGTITPDHTP
jgi:CheY-like chemotaxis protein